MRTSRGKDELRESGKLGGENCWKFTGEMSGGPVGDYEGPVGDVLTCVNRHTP